MISICVLTYGDYVTLAKRCIEPIIALSKAAEGSGLLDKVFLLGNQPTRELSRYLGRAAFEITGCDDIWANRITYPSNRFKYPVMRAVILGKGQLSWKQHTADSDLVMWLDDDSYIRTPTLPWLQSVVDKMDQCDMMGSVYTSLVGSREAWLRQQSWWRDKPFYKRRGEDVIKHATGGWWVAKTHMLRNLDFPPAELRHNGGDSLLGEMIHQQGLCLKHDRCDVAINADAAGRESHGERRGYLEAPIGTPGY